MKIKFLVFRPSPNHKLGEGVRMKRFTTPPKTKNIPKIKQQSCYFVIKQMYFSN